MSRAPRRRAASTVLPPILDLRAAPPLAADLLARRGKPLAVDGAAVERLGGQCLQVLLAGRTTWLADGHPFHIIGPSAALAEALAAMGAADLITAALGESQT